MAALDVPPETPVLVEVDNLNARNLFQLLQFFRASSSIEHFSCHGPIIGIRLRCGPGELSILCDPRIRRGREVSVPLSICSVDNLATTYAIDPDATEFWLELKRGAVKMQSRQDTTPDPTTGRPNPASRTSDLAIIQ